MEIVAAVLDQKEWDVNAADCMGSTALTWATRRGQDEVVKVLLEREDIDPNLADTQDGRTPHTLAAENGDERLVKILSERKDVCTVTPDNENQTPLSLALSKDHGGVVRILLERGNVDSNTGGLSGQASFPPSSRGGDECVAEIEFRYNDPNTDIANLDGQPTVEKMFKEQAVERSVTGEPKEYSILKGEQVGEKLKDVIINHRKGLQKMYGKTEAELDKCLKAAIERGEEMVRRLIMMGCNIEVAKDLTLLTLYDVAILIGMLWC